MLVSGPGGGLEACLGPQAPAAFPREPLGGPSCLIRLNDHLVSILAWLSPRERDGGNRGVQEAREISDPAFAVSSCAGTHGVRGVVPSPSGKLIDR